MVRATLRMISLKKNGSLILARPDRYICVTGLVQPQQILNFLEISLLEENGFVEGLCL